MTTPIRVGINGFGRIGRLAVRALQQHPGLQLAHVNEPHGGVATAAHLLEFDTVHGRYSGEIGVTGDAMTVDGAPVTFSDESYPGRIEWDTHGVDIVIEASGKFKDTASLQPHLDNGARKVVVAAPVKSDGVLNVVMGCNHTLFDHSAHDIVTAASCTTNSISPVVKVLHDRIGIERGALTTIHDVTNTQVIVDAPHKDLRRARSALNSLIPTSTGSATAVTMIIPELAGRLNGVAVRVPMLNSSLTDLVLTMTRDTSVDEVNDILRDAASTEPLAGILGYETRPLVSADYVNDTRSGIVDAPSTMVIDGRMVKVLVWYDNEFGYAHRLVELVDLVAAGLAA
ncbi:MAG: ArsJ-associated glyceraldehyde-3-phosphate dehydrogenase [Ilumatobacteraceae bacterium]